jgi:chromosome segregation ATPase
MGHTRDEIAQEFHRSTGTASNIWAKFRNKLGHYEADALRELGKQLRRQNMTVENCAKGFRISNIIEKLGIPEEKIKEFLITIYEISQKKDINPEILKDALIEFAQLSQEMPFSQIQSYLQDMKQEIKEIENKKNRLKEEIQILENEKRAEEEKTRSALKEANTTLVNLEIFVKTKNKLESYGIPVEDIEKFGKCVQGIKNYSNYDPFKMIEKFSDPNH